MSYQRVFFPKIWVNSGRCTQPELAGQCDCDCDCECYPRTPGELNSIALLANQNFRNVVFHKSDNAIVAPLTSNYWLTYPKGGSGRIAVLSDDAVGLLNEFSTPRTLHNLFEGHINDLEQLSKIVQIMLSWGLLESNPAIIQTGCVTDLSSTLVAWLHITQECNLKCSYCYLPKQPVHMREEILLQAIRSIFESAKKHGMGQVTLKFGGGEPTIHLPKVLKAQRLARCLAEEFHISLQSTLITNGTLLTQEYAKQLLESGIRVSVSLDGLDQYHDFQRVYAGGNGSFKQVQDSITNMQEVGLLPHIIITVTSRNLDGLPNFVKHLLNQGLTFNLNYFRENELAACYTDLVLEETDVLNAMRLTFAEIEANLPRWSLLGRLLDRANMTDQHSFPCGVGRNYIVVDTEGRVAKCQMDIANPVSSIWVDDLISDIRADKVGMQNPPVDTKPECQDCEWRYWCAGGCPLINKRVYGSYEARSPHCLIYRTLFPEVLRLEALRMLKYDQPWLPK